MLRVSKSSQSIFFTDFATRPCVNDRCVNPYFAASCQSSYVTPTQVFARAAVTTSRVAIAGASGPVAPTLANVQEGSYVPLSRPLFLYINDKQLSANQALRNFVTMTVANGMGLAQGAGSIPLPASTYRLVESKLYRHVTGSSFGGDLPVGLSIGEALRRSFDQLKLPQFR